MIKVSVVIIVFSLACLSVVGQNVDNTYRQNESNIYNQTFIQYIKYLEKENIKPDSIFIEEDFKLTDSLMAKIGNVSLIIIKQGELEQLVLKRGGLLLIRLFPLDFNNKEFYTSFVPFSVTYKTNEKSLFFCNSGSIMVIFSFVNRKFIFKKLYSYGI
jgi:hypothetical protein